MILRVFATHFTFLPAMFLLSLVFKMLQTRGQVRIDLGIIKEGNDGYNLFWRLWLVLVISQVVYLGVIIVIVWNYSPAFFNILRFYSLYSAFTCVRGVANSRYELYIAATIVAVAYWFSLTMSLLVSQWQSKL